MSDHSQGQGWWQASDGLWYPPEQWTGPEADQPRASEPASPPLPPPYSGPPSASAPATAGLPVPPPPRVSGAEVGPAAASVPWYHSWWLLIPLLVLCWPAAIALLW